MAEGHHVIARRGLRIAATLVFGSMLLAACGSSGDGSNSGTKTYTIAYQGPLSGDNAQLGINMDNGVQLAIEEANNDTSLGFKLKFTNSDDEGAPDKSPAAARKLIDNKDVVAVVGPAFSGATAAAEPLFSQANLISVSPSATRADLSSLGFTTFVRVVTGDNIQGAKMSDYIVKGLKSTKVYSIDDKSAYGAGLSKFVNDSLKAANVKVTSEGIAPTKDYSAIATKVKSSGAQTVAYSGYYAELSLLVKALRAAGYTGNIISGDGSKDDQLIKQAGAASDKVYLTCPCGPTPANPNADKFNSAYKTKFKSDPGTYSAEAYDAANTIIAAIKSLNGDVTREKLAAAVKSTTYEGITHTIKFDAKGEGGTGDIFVYQVTGGKINLLGKVEDVAK
jgi:branched-chain amino acid transport system substrate-binding protein